MGSGCTGVLTFLHSGLQYRGKSQQPNSISMEGKAEEKSFQRIRHGERQAACKCHKKAQKPSAAEGAWPLIPLSPFS